MMIPISRNRKILFSVVIGLIILIVAGLFIFNRLKDDESAGGESLSKSANILILGMDDADGNTNADLIMMVRYNLDSGSFKDLSIPNNTRIPSESGAAKSLEQIYAEGGVESVREAFANGLGIEVDYYASLDYSSFESAVDAIGGVEIVVDNPIRYRDIAGGVDIDIPAGKQSMDGSLALDYVRYKGNDARSRTERQFIFLDAALRKALDVKNVHRLPKLVHELVGGINTDIPIDTLAAMAGAAKSLNLDDIRMLSLPGEYSPEKGGIWIPDMDEIENMLKEF